MKKALIIGIDNYPSSPLSGCINDAVAIANTLENNGDGSPNFSVRLLTSNDAEVSTAILSEAIHNLFTGDADTVLLFFVWSRHHQSRYKRWLYREPEWKQWCLGNFPI